MFSVVGLVNSPVHAATAQKNITSYGAKTNDNVGDSTAIQKAINDTSSNVVYIPAGVFYINKPIELKENTTIIMHKNAVLKQSSENKSSLMLANFKNGTTVAKGASNITIKGGTIDMNGKLDSSNKPLYIKANSSAAMVFAYAKNIIVDGVKFKDGLNAHSIQLADINTATIKNCIFDGNYNNLYDDNGKEVVKEAIQIESGNKEGIPWVKAETRKSSKNITVENCTFKNNIQVGVGHHGQLYESRVENINIINNTFYNPRVAAIRFPGWNNVNIKGNTIRLNSSDYSGIRSGIHIYGTGTVKDKNGTNRVESVPLSKNIVIENNNIHTTVNNTRGISFTGTKASTQKFSNVKIYNNIIYFKATSGEGLHHIYADKVDKLSMELNRFSGNGQHIYLSKYTTNPSIKASLTVRFRDYDTDEEIAPAKISKNMALGKYTRTAPTIKGYKLVGSSKQSTTLERLRPDRTLTFKYKKI